MCSGREYNRGHSRGHNRGFTIIELLITISVASILGSMAIPSYNASIERNRVQTERDGLTSHLRLARSTAITNNTSIVICSSDDKISCSGSWKDGWIIFTDNDSSIVARNALTDPLLKVSDGVNSNHTLSWSNGSDPVVFLSNGYANTSGTFTFCGNTKNTQYAKALVVYATGSMRPGIDTNSNGIAENLNGGDLTC